MKRCKDGHNFGISNFLEQISNLSHSVVFLYFFALFTQEGFLLSLLFSGTLYLTEFINFPFLLCLLILFISLPFVRPPLTTILPCCISFSCGWLWSPPPVQFRTSVHSSSGILSDLIPWIYLPLPLYNHKGFDLDEWSSAFLYFLQFKSEFYNKKLMI